MTEKKSRLSRRHFLATMGAGGAAAAAAVVATKPQTGPQAAQPGDKRSTQGYHVTEHVKNYYRTTKV